MEPSDGGLDVLIDFFANQTTLTKVEFHRCKFGNEACSSELLNTFRANPTLAELTVRDIDNSTWQGATVGDTLCTLLQQNLNLRKLSLSIYDHINAALHLMLPGLRSNRTLIELDLYWTCLTDAHIRLIADALAENTVLQILNIRGNGISAIGLADIARVMASTQLIKIDFESNYWNLLDNEIGTQRFVDALARNKFLKVLRVCRIMPAPRQVAKVIRVLERNTVLEELELKFDLGEEAHKQLMESLPKMRGIKKLIFHGQTWRALLYNDPSFLPALHGNTSLEELNCHSRWHSPDKMPKTILATKDIL